jgi:YVTN family beta-propeller protein
VVATVTVGASPASFAFDSGKGEVFVANSGGNTVSVISDSNNSVVAAVTVGSNPYDLDYDSARGEIFVANTYSRSVSVISDSNNQVVATVPVGSGPLGVAYDPARGEVFVANSVSGTVSVISDSTNTVVATVTAGSGPGPMVYDSGKGEIYAVNRNSGTVSVISDTNNTVVANLTVGTKPYAATYDSGKGEVVVSNYGDGTLSLVLDNPSVSPPSPSSPSLLQQVWVPTPTNAVVAVGVSAVAVGAFALVFSALSNPLEAVGGAVGEKTKGIIPDNIKQWLEEVVASRRKLNAEDRTGSVFAPTKTELLAYLTAIVVLGFTFSYVKVTALSEIWQLLPVFFLTSILVGFVQKFFTITYLRSKGVWSEHKIWPLGLVLVLFTTVAFRVPFSSPTRSVHSEKFSERLGAITSAAEILIGLAFAGIFFLLMKAGFTPVGDAGLSMCVIGSFFGSFPVAPMSGKDIFDHSKPVWALLAVATMLVFVGWLFLV